MVPADVVASLEVVEAQLILEILVVAFDSPTPFDEGNELSERRVGREIGHPVLRGPVVPLGPFGNQPQFRLVSEGGTIVFGEAYPHGEKARGQRLLGAFAPGDLVQGTWAARQDEVANGPRRRRLPAA